MPQAKTDPWAQFADAPAVTTGEQENFNTPPPANDQFAQFQDAGGPARAPASPVATIPRPGMVDPRNPNPAAPPLIAGTDQTQFGDGAGATGPNRRLDPAQEAQLMGILWDPKSDINTAAARARQYMTSLKWPVPADAFEDSVQARKQGQKPGWLQYDKAKPFVDPNEGQSFLAGAASDIPGANKIESVIDSASTALGLGGRGDPNQSFGDNYRTTLDGMEATDKAASDAHPIYYGAGAVAGGLAVPTGVEGAAYRAAIGAGRDALLSGATPDAARAAMRVAARRAAGTRLAIEGGAYGGASGLANADNLPDALKGGLEDAAGGAVAGKVFGDLGARALSNITNAIPTDQVNYRNLAARLGVDPTPATVGGTPAGTVQLGLSALPGAASAVTGASDREVSGLGENAARLARSYGEPGTPASTGEALVDGATQYRNTSRAEAGALYNARDAAFSGSTEPGAIAEGGKAPIVLRNATTLADSLKADFPNSDVIRKLSESAVVGKVLGEAQDAGGPREITLNEAADALSHVRSVVRKMGPSESGLILDRATQLQNALQKDVYEGAAAADQAAGRVPGAPGSAVKAQQDADAFYADRAATLKGPLGKAIASSKDPSKVSAESVYTQLAADAAVRGGNIDRLRKTWFRLPEETRGQFAATYIDELGRPIPSARTLGDKVMGLVAGKGDEARLSDGYSWSADTFLKNFNLLSPAARRVMLGKEGEAQLLDIAQYASRLKQTGRFRNFSNTARNLTSASLVGAVGSALFHGQVGLGAEEIGGAAGMYAGAKLFLATPAMRGWTKAVLKTAAIEPAKQGSVQRVLIAKLGRIAAADPNLRSSIIAFQDRLMHGAASAPHPAIAKEGGNGSNVTDWSDPKYDSEDYSAGPAASNQAAPQPAPQPDPNGDLNGPDPVNDGSDGNYTDGTYR